VVALQRPSVELYDPIAMLVEPPPAWHRDALCQEHPEIDWFPDQAGDLTPARAVCARCLVRPECLAYALESGEKHGVWGGASTQQRHHAIREGWTAEELLYAIDSRVGPSVEADPNLVQILPEVPTLEADEPAATVRGMASIAAIPAPVSDPEKRACSTCEELFPVAELVFEHWCRNCW